MLKGHSIKLTNCKPPINSKLDIDYNGSNSLGSRIDPLVFVEALHVLKKNENPRSMQKAFHVVCVHFVETIRFKSIRKANATFMREYYGQHWPLKFILFIFELKFTYNHETL